MNLVAVEIRLVITEQGKQKIKKVKAKISLDIDSGIKSVQNPLMISWINKYLKIAGGHNGKIS